MKKTTKVQKNMDIIAMLEGKPVTHGTTVAEAIEHLHHENDMLSRKSSGERKPSAKQAENSKLSTIVLEWMKEQVEPKTVTDMMKEIPELEGMSNQKASALVKPLKDTGLLKKEVIKGRSYFSVNAD